MAQTKDLQEAYSSLEHGYTVLGDGAIDSSSLLVFDYEYPEQESEITMDSDEFTAVRP